MTKKYDGEIYKVAKYVPGYHKRRAAMLSNEDIREAHADGYDEGYREGYEDGMKAREIVEVMTKEEIATLYTNVPSI